jgi:hypothetical protein
MKMIRKNNGSPRAGRLGRIFSLVVPMVAIGLMVAVSVAAAQSKADNPEKAYKYHVSKKVDGLELIVGTQLIQVKNDADIADFTPLLFSLANLDHRGITVERDRIKLTDQYGTELPLATLSEVRKEYKRFRQDRQFFTTTNFSGQLERTTRMVRTNFFPLPGEIGIYRIQVPQWGKMFDLLYYKGTLTSGETYKITVDVKEEESDFTIEFQAP